MYKGVAQQVASPLEVYNQPANRFVAGFFGTMPMNFLNGVIRYKGDTIYFTTNSKAIQISNRMKDVLKAYKDKQLVLGIRPEHLSIRPSTSQSENNISCEVIEIELIGDRVNVSLKSMSGNKMIANINSHTNIQIGQSIILHVDLEKIHIFESVEMSKNISLDI